MIISWLEIIKIIRGVKLMSNRFVPCIHSVLQISAMLLVSCSVMGQENHMLRSETLFPLIHSGEIQLIEVPVKNDRTPFTKEDIQRHLTWTDKAAEEAYENAMKDEMWLSQSGERYTAMLVLEDGTAYGRLGETNGWVEKYYRFIESNFSENTQNTNGGNLGTVSEPYHVLHCGNPTCDRKKVIQNTGILTQFPRRTIGALNQSKLPGASPLCTGVKIGPRAVLTNSHCVFDEDGWITSGYFHPGKTWNAHLNAGGEAVRWSGVFARDWRIHRKYDYAVVFLEDKASAVELGWLGIAWHNNAAWYSGQVVNLTGYPGEDLQCLDSPFKGNDEPYDDCGGFMYEGVDVLDSSDFRTGGSDDDLLAYDMDSVPGMSGAPVWNIGSHTIYGVNWGGFKNVTNRYFSVRFRPSMYNDVCSWIADVPSIHATHAICH